MDTKLLLSHVFFLQIRDLYLQSDGSRVKHELRGCLGSCVRVSALRVMAVSVRAGRLGVQRPIILEALCAVLRSLFHVEQ